MRWPFQGHSPGPVCLAPVRNLPSGFTGHGIQRFRSPSSSTRWTRFAVSLSVAATAALVVAVFWFVTQHHELLPVTFVDARPLSLFRKVIGGVVILVLGG